jgi:excisionase family DNA binding protein
MPRLHAETLLKPGEVAELLRVDASTVKRWSRAGKLPFHTTLGGHRRYRLADIEAVYGDEIGVECQNVECLTKDATIAELRAELAAKDAELAAKDVTVREMKMQVRRLNRQKELLEEDIEELAPDALDDMRARLEPHGS